MDSQYLQRIRFQLQKRFRRLNSCGYQVFHSGVVQFWNYAKAHPLTEGILAKLDAETPRYETELEGLLKRQEFSIFETEHEYLGFVYRVIQHCVAQPLGHGLGPELNIARVLSHEKKHDDALNSFRETFLEPFYELLDEALDQQAAVLSLLIKYKRKVEWFDRDAIAALTGDERALAKHLYAYLFDQGLDFQIEPSSASGEADLVASDLVLDAKVFDGGRRGVPYIASGVHQVHTYARDFNQDVGYLLIYKTCPEQLDFTFSTSGQLAPHIIVGGKIIYLVSVDVCAYEATASKRGTLKVHSISGETLLQAVQAQDPK